MGSDCPNLKTTRMDMKLRKELRDFIKWQIRKDMLKDELTIDYEIAEAYLEQENQGRALTIDNVRQRALIWWKGLECRIDLVKKYYPQRSVNDVDCRVSDIMKIYEGENVA